jgi:phosphohistidine phosphatase
MGAMRQLLLLRHAKSSRDDPRLADRDRPLSARGHRDAAIMRGAMRDLGLAPDLVLVSPSRRTIETLEALEPWEDVPLIEPVEVLYLAGPAQLLTVLHGVAETVRSVLVIAHNPGLHELAIELAGSAPSAAEQRLRTKFPTAALAEFTVSGLWGDVGRGATSLVRFVTPSELRDG